MKIKLLKHLKEQIKERKISVKTVEETLSKPEQIISESKNLTAAQRRYFINDK